MYKIYMVMLKFGFNGVKYFMYEKNAIQYAKEVNEKVESEYCTAKEYFSLCFEDISESPFIENMGIQFNII